MTDEAPERGDTEELRALLLRLLIEAGPGNARLEQLVAAMEQAAKPAADGPDDTWPAELAALKADIATLREAITHHTPLAELLARSDAQLAVLLADAEKRAGAELSKLGAQVSALTERLSQLEAQIRKLTTGTTTLGGRR